jgi:threonylcarbamoyladenosine tRNA methylthiotransferase MtaB
MNRHYDSAFYLDLVTRIRNTFENSSITTDIMVGFPSETEEEFNESFEFVKKVAFAKAHIFSYSRREGTIAAALKNQVLKSEKTVRSRRMQKLCEETELDFLNSQLEKVESVLFETLENGFYVGYTPNYTKIYLESDTDISGKILSVKLTDIKNDGCLGVLN